MPNSASNGPGGFAQGCGPKKTLGVGGEPGAQCSGEILGDRTSGWPRTIGLAPLEFAEASSSGPPENPGQRLDGACWACGGASRRFAGPAPGLARMLGAPANVGVAICPGEGIADASGPCADGESMFAHMLLASSAGRFGTFIPILQRALGAVAHIFTISPSV